MPVPACCRRGRCHRRLAAPTSHRVDAERTSPPDPGSTQVVALWPLGDAHDGTSLSGEALEYDAATGLVGVKGAELSAPAAALADGAEAGSPQQVSTMDGLVAAWEAQHG